METPTNGLLPYGVQHSWRDKPMDETVRDLDDLHARAFGSEWGDPISRWGEETATWVGVGATVSYTLLYPGGATELKALLESAGAENVKITPYPVSPEMAP